MKKHSLLVLLPFALIVTGCGGLGKGSIFNEKFMKRNFGNLETKYEREAPHKVSLDLGTGVTAVVPAQAGILTVSKDENKGYFSVYANKYVLSVDNYDAVGGMSIIHNNTLDRNFFVGKKTADEVTTGAVYDDDANKLYEGKMGNVSISYHYLDMGEIEGNEEVLVKINIDGVAKSYVTYNLDGSLKQILSEEEYISKNPYLVDGFNLAEYGHKDILLTTSYEPGIGYRYAAFNTKKGKFISSFVTPEDYAALFVIGDSVIYQTVKEVEERAKKYDFYDVDMMGVGRKYNYETYSVNYMNGKQSKINTKFVLNSLDDNYDLYNKKGIFEYEYAEGVRTVGKDKVLSKERRSLIFNEKLKEVADVTGVRFSSLEEVSENLYQNNAGVIYDEKLKEVGYINSVHNDFHIVNYNGVFGLVDHTGKVAYRPVALDLEYLGDGYYYALLTDKVQILKMNDKEKVEIVKEVLSSDYEFDYITASSLHLAFVNSEAKEFILDVTIGQMTEAPVPETTDTFVSSFADSFIADTLAMTADVYKSGDAYYAIRCSTKTAYSYPKF